MAQLNEPALSETPHRRRNLLTGEWTLVSPHRAKRPWQGKLEPVMPDERPNYDAACYLCPTNVRAGGTRNPDYSGTFAFTNDFAAMISADSTPDNAEKAPEKAIEKTKLNTLFQAQAVQGTCRVLCFSPRHDLTLAEMTEFELRHVVDLWMTETAALGQHYKWVQVFENKGELMGCSNPHPHGQVWAMNSLPNEALKEDREQRRYFDAHQRPLLCDYLEAELADGQRVILHNEHWAALVPFWAVYPFETMLVPRRHVPRITALDEVEQRALSTILKQLLVKYDNLFETSFPYSMGWHGAPFGDEQIEHWQLHAHFYPPLLRSATVKKFLVGFELLAEPQRDLTPEQAAAGLRAASDVHYKLHRKP